MPRTIGEVENQKKKEYGRNVKEFDRDFYQTPDWRNFKEEVRKKRREKDENIVTEFYNNNTEHTSADDLYNFINDDKKYPMCVYCKIQGKLKQGNVLDHIHPISLGGARLLESNVQFLCTDCHRIKTKKEMRREYE